MDGMEFWLATVSDSEGLYASELIWCDGDRETAWQSLGSESEVRQEGRRLGIPVRLDGPFTIGGTPAAPDNACGQCEGTGTTQSASNLQDEECPVCDGSGTLPEDDSDGVDDVECAAALVRDGLVLLDAVEHVDDGALADGRLVVIPAAGQSFRVTVALVGEQA